MPYVTVNDRRLYFAQHRQAGPALLLIHGAGGNHLHWPAELRRLPGASVYALDLPGHGRSEGAGCDTIKAYVQVVVGLLDALEVERAVLVGHSMGGGISQMMALDHPDRVAGLVLVGTGARLRVAPTILEGLLNEPEQAIELITGWAWAPGAPEPLVDLGRQAMLDIPPQVIHADFLACDRFDVMGRLKEIIAPTLVVSGTEDRLTPPKYGRYLQEHIPQAQLVLVEGGGHMVALEQPVRVAQAVETFVGSL